MATAGRRADSVVADDSVEKRLFERGFEFDFFQAVRLLVRLLPGRRAVGEIARSGEEAVRFHGPTSLAFPASAVERISRPDGDGAGAAMTVAFIGLTGVAGVLPFHYTERIIARAAGRDSSFAAFLDLFNHRFTSFFYRAWQKHRPAMLAEAAALRGAGTDDFSQYLFDLLGMGTGRLRGRMRIHDRTLLRYTGLIAQAPRSATALRAILRDYIGVPLEIQQFQGRWYKIPEDDRAYLSGESERNQLGAAAFAGSRVWDQQACFRVRIGPVDLNRFQELMPGSDGLLRVIEFTRFLVGQSIGFDVQVVLAAAAVPKCRLVSTGNAAPRLGWLGWLKTGEFVADAEQAVFRVEAA